MRYVLSTRTLVLFLFIGNVASGAYLVTMKLKPAVPDSPQKIKILQKGNAGVGIEKYRKEVVRPALAAKNEAIENCFNQFLQTEPQRNRGNIRLSWIITKEGKVADLKLLGSDLKDENLEQCVTEHVKSLSFAPPPQEEDVHVAHKFKFQSRSPASINF